MKERKKKATRRWKRKLSNYMKIIELLKKLAIKFEFN